MKLFLNNISEIESVTNPELIKHLITKNYYNEFSIFENLEIIELRDTDTNINEDLLRTFNKLKKLTVYLSENFEYSEKDDIAAKTIDIGIINNLKKILEYKLEVAIYRQFDMYLEGVKIENDRILDDFIREHHYPYWTFRLNANYSNLDTDLVSIDRLEYDELQNCYEDINDLPFSFFEKFQYINQVDVGYSVKNVNGLNWFLNNVTQLSTLVINELIKPDRSLGQAFYTNLPNTIRYLYINNKEDINYEFISKLTELIAFETQVDKDLFGLAVTSFSNLNHLKRFQFEFNRKKIEIVKEGRDLLIKNFN